LHEEKPNWLLSIHGSSDDSSGTIGGVIEQGFSLIDEIIDTTEFNISQKGVIFENLMKEASHRRYDGWSDWRLNFLESCSRISDTSKLRNKLEKHMALLRKKENSDSWIGSYFAEKVNQIRYNMILQNDGEQKALEFIEQNLQFSSFRKMTIERAMKNNDYEQVIKLTLDGEAKDKSFSNIYTQILIEEGEKEKLLEYVKKSPSSVEGYYKHLIPEFKEEVYELFIKYIEQAALRASDRRGYQGVCAIIRNLKKAGGKEPALAIKQKLFNQYAKRPAFRDELTRV